MFAGAAEEPASARTGGDVIKADIVQKLYQSPIMRALLSTLSLRLENLRIGKICFTEVQITTGERREID